MVRGDGQQTNECAIPIRYGSAGLGDTHAAKGRDAGRRFDTDDFFPMQTLVPVNLLPVGLAQLILVIASDCLLRRRILMHQQGPTEGGSPVIIVMEYQYHLVIKRSAQVPQHHHRPRH